MKISFTLSETDIKQAILVYVRNQKGIDVKSVHLSYYAADSRDPRETSYFSATVSE